MSSANANRLDAQAINMVKVASVSIMRLSALTLDVRNARVKKANA